MLLAALLACASPGDLPFQPPDAWGPWPVGTREDAVQGRTGELLPLQVWFPASSAGDQLYLYDGLVAGRALSQGVPDCSEPRPVLVFSHGFGGIRYQSLFFTEYLASHGWVVAAVDHAGNTLFDLDEDRTGELALRRPWDVADSFDRVVELASDPEDPLRGCVDEGAGYVVAGHSFGGYTALAVAGAILDLDAFAAYCDGYGGWLCDELPALVADNPGQSVFDHHDPRARALVAMAPGGREALEGSLDLVQVPALVLGGSLDDTATWGGQVAPIWNHLGSERRYLGRIEGSGHYGFTEICSMAAPFIDECGEEGFADPERVHELTDTVSGAFLQVLDGRDEARAWLPPRAEDLSWWRH